jgi:hypothetical protein
MRTRNPSKLSAAEWVCGRKLAGIAVLDRAATVIGRFDYPQHYQFQ